MTIAYIVTADFTDVAVAGEWVDWLKGGHIQEVLDGGATSCAVVRLEPEDSAPLRIEVRYRFPSMHDFTRYLKEYAPRLRGDAQARFPSSRGVTMTRRVGEVLFELPA